MLERPELCKYLQITPSACQWQPQAWNNSLVPGRTFATLARWYSSYTANLSTFAPAVMTARIAAACCFTCTCYVKLTKQTVPYNNESLPSGICHVVYANYHLCIMRLQPLKDCPSCTSEPHKACCCALNSAQHVPWR